MDRPSSSTNPLFLEQDDDPNNYVTKLHLFGTQRALHQEQQAMSDRIDHLATDLRLSSNAQETTSTTSSMNTNKKMTQEWTRIVPCWSTALLPLRPTQDGAARVDTPTTPSPSQVLRHRTLFIVSRVKIVKQTEILYTTTTLKSKLTRKNIDTVKTKLLSCKHKNGNVNANNTRKSVRDNTKMHKMPRHNAKNNNYVKLKHLRRNVPSEIQVEP
ncbi:hypothetical protein VPH35_077636 [Triticum aestivum]